MLRATPELVASAAAVLGIEHSDPAQARLLGVARCFVEQPLPSGWSSVNAEGVLSYRNDNDRYICALSWLVIACCASDGSG